MTDQAAVFALARSARYDDRVRAAGELAAIGTPAARAVLVELLADEADVAVPGAAAAALLGHDDWDPVLDRVWRCTEVAVSEALRAAFVDLLLAGVDVEPVLAQRSEAGATSAVRKGALVMLMALGMRPAEYVPDDD